MWLFTFAVIFSTSIIVILPDVGRNFFFQADVLLCHLLKPVTQSDNQSQKNLHQLLTGVIFDRKNITHLSETWNYKMTYLCIGRRGSAVSAPTEKIIKLMSELHQYWFRPKMMQSCIHAWLLKSFIDGWVACSPPLKCWHIVGEWGKCMGGAHGGPAV